MRRTFRWPQFDNVRLQKFEDADRLSIVLKLLDLKMHYRFKYLRLRKSLFIRILALLLEKLVSKRYATHPINKSSNVMIYLREII